MRGEFFGVWSETAREIWQPLVGQPLDGTDGAIPADVFCELFRTLAGDPKTPGALRTIPSVEALANILDNPLQSRRAFGGTAVNALAGECELAGFFEAAYDPLEELGGDALANLYFSLLADVIDRLSPLCNFRMRPLLTIRAQTARSAVA
jgi:hypothetical protein